MRARAPAPATCTVPANHHGCRSPLPKGWTWEPPATGTTGSVAVGHPHPEGTAEARFHPPTRVWIEGGCIRIEQGMVFARRCSIPVEVFQALLEAEVIPG